MVTSIHNPLQHEDADLHVRVAIALTLRQRQSLREIDLEVIEGVVHLRGTLPSFFDRQLAVETARRVAGVVQVQDNLWVAEGLYGKVDRFQVTHSRAVVTSAPAEHLSQVAN
jgi:hypothetical protein